jgi:hypothetical protein
MLLGYDPTSYELFLPGQSVPIRQVRQRHLSLLIGHDHQNVVPPALLFHRRDEARGT